ncbi:hypothetical protein [Roseibium sp.]|uniref:hypothetical protein n=1 Tax=Roseibium sp. TaxID=1936156 RepID=UPI001B2E71BE|nr:hypothetical protein [Roseibium sp.]MBO6858363.1 hypothetical protein [Roseibium sp.]
MSEIDTIVIKGCRLEGNTKDAKVVAQRAIDKLLQIPTEGGVLGEAVVGPIDEAIKILRTIVEEN